MPRRSNLLMQNHGEYARAGCVVAHHVGYKMLPMLLAMTCGDESAQIAIIANSSSTTPQQASLQRATQHTSLQKSISTNVIIQNISTNSIAKNILTNAM